MYTLGLKWEQITSARLSAVDTDNDFLNRGDINVDLVNRLSELTAV